MSNFDIVRAWKDENYRQSLSSEEQALLPANPAGSIELSDELLDMVAGGDEASTAANFTAGCCSGATICKLSYTLVWTCSLCYFL